MATKNLRRSGRVRDCKFTGSMNEEMLNVLQYRRCVVYCTYGRGRMIDTLN